MPRAANRRKATPNKARGGDRKKAPERPRLQFLATAARAAPALHHIRNELRDIVALLKKRA